MYKLTITYNTHDIPFPTTSINVQEGDIRHLAMLYEHSKYVKRFKIEDERKVKMKPSDFNFICPYSNNPNWYEGAKWSW